MLPRPKIVITRPDFVIPPLYKGHTDEDARKVTDEILLCQFRKTKTEFMMLRRRYIKMRNRLFTTIIISTVSAYIIGYLVRG